MRTCFTALFSCLFATFFIFPNISFAQAKTAESNAVSSGEISRLPFDVTSSWRITVNRDARSQVPQIPEGVKGDDTKKFLINAISAFTKGEIVKMNAELIETAQFRMLILTPATGNKMITIQGQDGDFEGTLTNPAGIVLGVKIQKIPEKELSAIKALQEGTPIIEVVAADVPAPCARFIGGWTGDWEFGKRWIWLTGIDAKCIAKYSYGPQKMKDFQLTEINDGTLSFPCGSHNGTCSFSYHGDELWGWYVGTDGTNRAVFKKVLAENN